MDEMWTTNDPAEVARAQAIWDALNAGDYTPAIEANSDAVIFENGPGADGKTERVWTVDLDSEDMERFWARNPVRDTSLEN